MISPSNGDSSVILTIPMRAEYVSIARLTAAGVANRIGFNIEIIEDIKVSLSEVCNRIINTLNKHSERSDAECKIEFLLSKNSLGIDFYIDNNESFDYFMPDSILVNKDIYDAEIAAGNENLPDEQVFTNEGHIEEYDESQLQLSLITLLMDEFIVNPSENCLVSMKKYLE